MYTTKGMRKRRRRSGGSDSGADDVYATALAEKYMAAYGDGASGVGRYLHREGRQYEKESNSEAE